jgi:hypothetical protein
MLHPLFLFLIINNVIELHDDVKGTVENWS